MATYCRGYATVVATVAVTAAAVARNVRYHFCGKQSLALIVIIALPRFTDIPFCFYFYLLLHVYVLTVNTYQVLTINTCRYVLIRVAGVKLWDDAQEVDGRRPRVSLFVLFCFALFFSAVRFGQIK